MELPVGPFLLARVYRTLACLIYLVNALCVDGEYGEKKNHAKRITIFFTRNLHEIPYDKSNTVSRTIFAKSEKKHLSSATGGSH